MLLPSLAEMERASRDQGGSVEHSFGEIPKIPGKSLANQGPWFQ